MGELFREYSRPWERLALVHIEDVWNVTRVFVDEALRHVFDETAADGLFRERLDEGLELLRQSARTKLDELIDVHRSHPMTSNPQFLNLIERSKAKRIDCMCEFLLVSHAGELNQAKASKQIIL